MKIKDLEFENHPAGVGGRMAKVKFANGYGASVITGPLCFTRDDAPYEIGVTGEDGDLTFETPVTDGVIGYLTEEEADKVMEDIEALPPVTEQLDNEGAQ